MGEKKQGPEGVLFTRVYNTISINFMCAELQISFLKVM
jgi:hypothetical protein